MRYRVDLPLFSLFDHVSKGRQASTIHVGGIVLQPESVVSARGNTHGANRPTHLLSPDERVTPAAQRGAQQPICASAVYEVTNAGLSFRPWRPFGVPVLLLLSQYTDAIDQLLGICEKVDFYKFDSYGLDCLQRLSKIRGSDGDPDSILQDIARPPYE
jgi:hypothetical protein